MKKLPLNSLFLVNFSVFPLDLCLCFEKVPCMAIYIIKVGVWNVSLTMWDSFQTSALMHKICLFMFLEPNMRMQA